MTNQDGANGHDSPAPMMRLDEVARRMDVTVKTVRRYVTKGALEVVRLPSGRIRVTEDAYRACIGG